MQISYQISEQDFRDGISVHQNRSFFSRWSRRYILAILAFALVVSIALLIHEPSADTWYRVAPFIGPAVFGLLWFFALPRWAARKQYESQPAAHSSNFLEITDTGFRSKCDLNSSETAWGAYTHWWEAERVFVLYTSNVQMHIIPKRAFTGEQLAEFRALLAEKVPHK